MTKTPRNANCLCGSHHKKEGNKTVTICNALKLKSVDGKMYLTDVADTKAKDYLKIEES